MKNKAFESLIEIVNAQLQILKNNGYAIYDKDNPEYFINAVKYNPKNDQVEYETEEDKRGRQI